MNNDSKRHSGLVIGLVFPLLFIFTALSSAETDITGKIQLTSSGLTYDRRALAGMSWAWYVPRKYGYKIYITFTPLNPACQIKAQVYATSPWGCGAGACNPFPVVNAVGAGPGAPVTMEYDLGKAFACCPWGWYNDYFNAYIKYESMNSACYSGPFVKAEMAAPPAMGSLFAGSPYPCGGW